MHITIHYMHEVVFSQSLYTRTEIGLVHLVLHYMHEVDIYDDIKLGPIGHFKFLGASLIRHTSGLYRNIPVMPCYGGDYRNLSGII